MPDRALEPGGRDSDAAGPIELSAAQARFLLSHRVAHLATAGEQDEPHVVPVCFALAGSYLYTPLDRKPKSVPVTALRRVRDLVRNPMVCLLVDDYDDDWTRLAWLQVRGRAGVVVDGAELQAALDALRLRYPQYTSGALAIDGLPVIRITPTRVIEWSWSGHSR